MTLISIQTVTGKYVTNIHFLFIKSIHVTCIKLYCASFIPTDFISIILYDFKNKCSNNGLFMNIGNKVLQRRKYFTIPNVDMFALMKF